MPQSIRDAITGELTLDYFMKRSAEGWRLASVEWVRDTPSAVKPVPEAMAGTVLSEPAEPPYGLQVAQGTLGLEENPLEATVMLLILEQIVKEKRVTEIARELNRQGHFTREGRPWGAVDIFDLLPRLIEAGPVLLKSGAWRQRKQGWA